MEIIVPERQTSGPLSNSDKDTGIHEEAIHGHEVSLKKNLTNSEAGSIKRLNKKVAKPAHRGFEVREHSA